MADPSQGAPLHPELVYWWAPRGAERVFDLSGWPEEAVAMVRALLEEDGMEHRWEDGNLVVDAAQRDDAAALLDDVVAANRPHLDEDADRTAYDLADWPDYELELLRAALEDSGVLFEWTEEGELLVYEADEGRVDELFERLDLRGPDPGIELDGEALTNLLTTLFVAADRLAGDPDDADAVLNGHRAILELEQLAVPYGMNPDGWEVLVADSRELRRLIEADAGGNDEQPFEAINAHLARDAGEDEADHADDADGADDADVADGGAEDLGDADHDGVGEGADIQDALIDEDDEDPVRLSGDDAIMAVAGRVRDRLKRIL